MGRAVPFPELTEEGYTAEDELYDVDSVHWHPDDLPDFWEIREGSDGQTYCIDHIGTRIMRMHA